MAPEDAEDDDCWYQYNDAQRVECDADVNSINVCLIIATATTRKRAIAKALHLEGRTTSRQTFWVFRVCLV